MLLWCFKVHNPQRERLITRNFVRTILVGTLLLVGAVAAFGANEDLFIHGDTPLPDRMPPRVWMDPVVDAPPAGGLMPIRLTLDAPGYVTLVIEDDRGVRVRNLVSEQFFAAGEHVIDWDGLDEAGIPSITMGAYDLHPNLVAPGHYQVRGLVRGPVELRYEWSAYTAGQPPWRTPDGTGGWLADHSPPSGLVFLPGEKPRLLIGSLVAEAGDGLVWTDRAGRKLAGTRSIGAGGGWCGGYLLARDAAAGSPEAFLTVAWGDRIELWSINPHRDIFGAAKPAGKSVQGIAVRRGLVVLSLDEADQLLLVNAETGELYARPTVERPRGLVFDGNGRLLVLAGEKLLRFALANPAAGMKLPAAEVVIANGLADASQIVLDSEGRFYISFHGQSHQVKVYAPTGEFLHDIGDPGGVQLGPYNPRRMQYPTGLAVTDDGHLWVAETAHSPKRVSVWTLDGSLVNWLVGPPQYGGGGSLSADKRRFYYGGIGNFGLEFAVDWAAGLARLANIYYLASGPGNLGLSSPGAWINAPQQPLTAGGREYLTQAWNTSPTGGASSIMLWMMRDNLAMPVAAVGAPEHWPLLGGAAFQARRQPAGNQLFAWSDLNNDGQVQPAEVTFLPQIGKMGELGPLQVETDLSVTCANSLVLRPRGFTAAGVPIYDANDFVLKVENLMTQVHAGGGGQTIAAPDGFIISTGGPMRGFRDGHLVWTYPSRWPSLEASHWGEAWRIARIPAPAPGLMMGTTKLIGPTLRIKDGEAGYLWAINSNCGSIYLVTTDGLFLATLFPDRRVPGAAGRVPADVRGASFNAVTPGEENFWPAITQTDDGEIYVVTAIRAGGVLTHSSVVHVEGLDTVQRIKPAAFAVTPAQLRQAQEQLLVRAAAARAHTDRPEYQVALTDQPIAADGDLRDWPAAWTERNGQYLAADTAGRVWIQVGELPFGHRWHPLLGAVRVSDQKLHVAFSVSPRGALGTVAAAAPDSAGLLTAGAGLEIALATDPLADPARTQPVPGDIRVVISTWNGRPIARLYRAVDPGSPEPVTLRSPWGGVTIDGVTDISGQVQFGQSRTAYEASIPLAMLGIEPRPGLKLRADFGILNRPYRVLDATGTRLRVAEGTTAVAGHEERVLQRIYWCNPAPAVETGPAGAAVFTPHLWGTWEFTEGK